MNIEKPTEASACEIVERIRKLPIYRNEILSTLVEATGLSRGTLTSETGMTLRTRRVLISYLEKVEVENRDTSRRIQGLIAELRAI